MCPPLIRFSLVFSSCRLGQFLFRVTTQHYSGLETTCVTLKATSCPAAGTLIHRDSQLGAFGKLNGILDLGKEWSNLPGAPDKIKKVVEDLKSLID